MNTNFRSTTISTAPHEWRRAFHRGYVDWQNRAPWPHDWDVMSKREQLGYEQGRLLAAEAVTAGIPLPYWRGDKAGADKMDDLWRRTEKRIAPYSIVP